MSWQGADQVTASVLLAARLAASLTVVLAVTVGCGRRVATVVEDDPLEVRFGSSSNNPSPPLVVLMPSQERPPLRTQVRRSWTQPVNPCGPAFKVGEYQ
jgi:hypothetical protein